MALWFSKSRTIIHHLKRMVGFMGVFHQNIWISSSSSYMQPGPLSSVFIPGIHKHRSTPSLFPFNSSISTRFSLQRFKSTQPASQHEHMCSTDDDGGDNSQVNLILKPSFLVDIYFFSWSWTGSFYPFMECWAHKTLSIHKKMTAQLLDQNIKFFPWHEPKC